VKAKKFPVALEDPKVMCKDAMQNAERRSSEAFQEQQQLVAMQGSGGATPLASDPLKEKDGRFMFICERALESNANEH